jgi:hypothetical protein
VWTDKAVRWYEMQGSVLRRPWVLAVMLDLSDIIS